jgi:hypothetical protein
MRIGNTFRWLVAIGLLILSFVNASWMAPAPTGALRLIGAKVGAGGDCPSLEDTRRALINGGGTVVLRIDPESRCATPASALAEFPRYRFIFDTADGEGALAMFEAAKRPIDERYAFFGAADALAPIRSRNPEAWIFTIAEGRKCFQDYSWMGWLSFVPESCAGGTILVPLDQKWKVAGWPRRFQARMAAAGTRIILTGPGEPGDSIPGLTRLDQIPEIPRDYTGSVWVDDIALIGPSIRR